MSGVPENLPPLREINHLIPLIDEGKTYCYHLPRCPDVLKPQLINKINRYERAGTWATHEYTSSNADDVPAKEGWQA